MTARRDRPIGMVAGVAALLAAGLHPGPGFAEDASPCAKIEEPFAYNACLAKQNPRAADVRPLREPEAAGARPGEETPLRRPSLWEYFHARNHGLLPAGRHGSQAGRGRGRHTT